jgi:hypothetical protein
MKLSTLAFIAATVAIPTAAFADSSQPKSAPGTDAPAATMHKGSQKGSMKSGTTGAGAADSSIPGATNPNTSGARGRSHVGEPAGDSSLPGTNKK